MAADLLRRYVHALAMLPAGAWLVSVSAFFLLLAGITALPVRRSPAFAWVGAVAFAACVVAWASSAWRLRWACDDAFISFRYARNWVDGHGLVYNFGERVEGYTDFLWTALIASGMLLRVDPVRTALCLSFASGFVALLVAWKLSLDLTPNRAAPLIAPSVVLLAGNLLFAEYTTSGLETMMGATLSLLAVQRAVNGQRFAAGCAGILATMTHPDHGLAYAALGVALVFEPDFRSASWAARLRYFFPYAAPFLFLYVPYFAFRTYYYGSLVPNTYYAKSANAAYFSQGWKYIAISAVAAGLVGALPLVVAGWLALRNTLFGRYFAILAATYLVYVGKLGGDFMLGRLLVLLLLPTAVTIDAGARTLWQEGRHAQRALIALGAVGAMTLVIHTAIVHNGEKYHQIADEETFYPLRKVSANGVMSNLTGMARDFAVALKTVRDRPTMVTGCIGIFGYLTGLRIVDAFGLTDAHVAREAIATRGRPGHEKNISTAYAIESGGDFTDLEMFPAEYDAFTVFHVAHQKYYLLAHRPTRIAQLKRGRNVRLPNFARLLARYPGKRAPAKLECDLSFLDTLYFRHHPPAELQAFVQRLVGEQRLDPALQAFQSVSAGSDPAGFRRVRSFELDSPKAEGFTGAADIARDWSARVAPVAQSEVGNAHGGFVDTFTIRKGDRAVGELSSPAFVVTGDVIELYVGGGRRDGLEVVLEIDGAPVARTSGCNMEWLGRRLWNVAPYKGQHAVIRIRDQSSEGWGHLIVDRITEWQVAGAAP